MKVKKIILVLSLMVIAINNFYGQNYQCEESKDDKISIFEDKFKQAFADEHSDINELLIKLGADINISDNHGRTPLIIVLNEGDYRIHYLELEENTRVEGITYEWTPLMIASQKRLFEVTKLLIELGADFNLGSKYERVRLMSGLLTRGNLETVKLLIEAGANINLGDQNGWTPLLHHSEVGRMEIIKLLIDLGADVNLSDKDGLTPLLGAVGMAIKWRSRADWDGKKCERKLCNLGVVKLLIELGADVNLGNKDGLTPLLKAVEHDDLEMVKLLVDSGADINVGDKDGQTPLLRAVKRAISNIKLYYNGRRYDDLEMVKLLIDLGADINLGDKDSQTPLLRAVEIAIQCELCNRGREVTKILIESGANVNLGNKDGWTPLLRAVEYDDLEMVKLLVDSGADINFALLLRAALYSNLEVVKLLIKSSADNDWTLEAIKFLNDNNVE